MRATARTLKNFALSLLAVFGLMGLMAVGAQGEWLFLVSTAEMVASSHEESRLLVPKKI